MKIYKDTEKEIKEGDIYFAVEVSVLPIVKREDKYYAHISMSVFDDQSEESDSIMFEKLEDAIKYCIEDPFFNGVSYSDFRINKTIFINK